MPVIETKGALSSQGYGEFAQSGAGPVYVEDVFSTTIYTGNGVNRFINNGIALGNTNSGTSIEFNKANNYLVRSSDLVGNIDSKSFTISFWIYTSSDYNTIYRSDSSRVEMLVASQDVYFDFKNTSGSSILRGNTTGLRVPYGQFVNVLMSVNLNALTVQLYINDVDRSSAITYVAGPTNALIDFTDTSFGVGAQTDGSLLRSFYLSDLFLDYTYRDLSVTANRRLFVTADLKPASGQSSLNPIVYLPFNNFASPASNLGTGGAFTSVNTSTIIQFGPNSVSGLGKGGMVWLKSRSGTANHSLYDTVRGATFDLASNSTAAQTTQATGLTAFNSAGFSIGTLSTINTNAEQYASWTFREQSKFFDVVTYTGNGSSIRSVPHNLGSVPGCIIVKRTDAAGHNWCVYHRSLPTSITYNLFLNTTDAQSSDDNMILSFSPYLPTSTEFYVQYAAGATAGRVNFPGATYVAYVFAHDAGGFGAAGTDNIISCGSFTTNASGAATVTLGYEPQLVLVKSSSAIGDWILVDTMRGMGMNNATYSVPGSGLNANSGSPEGSANILGPNPNGFTTGQSIAISTTFVYIAIRRGPMKTPTTGTSVFQPVVYTGTNVDYRLVTTGIVTDFIMARQRNSTTFNGFIVGDRLRGNPYLSTGAAAAAVLDTDSLMTPTANYGNAFSAVNGFGCGNDATAQLNISTVASNQVVEAFARAPGFLDVVNYTGTGVARTINHNLGAVPQMMWVKNVTTAARNWMVYFADSGASSYIELNLTGARTTGDTSMWNGTAPTSTVFSVGTSNNTNQSPNSFIAYLMGNVTGVSRVSYYVGRGVGTSHQVDCGFTSGARMVLIKSVNATGSWYLWDSARGIVAGNDPYILTNSAAAEVTSTDYIDSFAGGFEVSSTAIAELNNGYANVITSNSAGRAEEDGIYDGTRFLGITTSLLYQSTDGLSWTSAAHGVTNARCIGYNGTNLYVIGGNSGGISTSTDRTTWTPRTSGTANPLLGVTYGFGKWWICGGSGTILSSTDGITWSSVTSGVAVTLEDIKFVNGILLAVGASGTIVKSTDGVTFTSTTLPVGTLNGIAYGNGLYVVVGNSSVLYTSPDATTWTVRSVPGANNISSIAWTGVRFVTGGGSGTTRVSNDGITWTAGDTGSGGLGVVMYGNDMVVIGSTSAGAVYNSSPKYMFWAIA